MNLTVWRVVPAKYAEPPHNPFDGEGARLLGGRWNSPGVAVVYTSGNLSLAVLETLVHADSLAAIIGRVVFPVTIPTALIREIPPTDLPRDWQSPVAPEQLRQLGDTWVTAAETPVLRVPSAVIPTESNYLINPYHPQFLKVLIGAREPLPIDPRLLKSSERR